MTFSAEEQEIYDITLELLHTIRKGDIETYKRLSSEQLSAIEPETSGNVVVGLDFHLFFLKNTQRKDYHFEIVNPFVKVYNDTAYIAYTLIDNKLIDNNFKIKTVFETRVYHKENGSWKMVHFHRNN